MKTRFMLCGFLLGTIFLKLASAQQADEKGAKQLDIVPKAKLATISVDQEKEILAFVSKNDASLHRLLGNLKTARPTEYQKALIDLNRVTERLTQVKRNRPHAYELELKKWQTQSKVQVLAARLATNPSPQTRAELKQAIELRADLELQVLRADREVVNKRLKLLDDQIMAAESSKESRIQQQFDRSIATASRSKGAPKKRPSLEGSKSAGKQETPTEASKREGAK